jgi:NAD(P)H-dependent FMN reductase
MKRMWFLVGIVTGIIIGSGMGRGPYEKVQNSLRALGDRPEARKVRDSLHTAATDISDTAAESIIEGKEKVQAKMESAVS